MDPIRYIHLAAVQFGDPPNNNRTPGPQLIRVSHCIRNRVPSITTDMMTVQNDLTYRGVSGQQLALEDRFEVLKEIGDGSFGSVVLGRVRTAGANVARRGTVVSQYDVHPLV